MALSNSHSIMIVITTLIMAGFCCERCYSAKVFETYPVTTTTSEMSIFSKDEMGKSKQMMDANGENDSEEGFSPNVEKVIEDDKGNTLKTIPNIDKESCLSITSNNMSVVYSFPDDTYYIWFKPLTQDTVLKLQFDYSIYKQGGMPMFPAYSKYKYQVKGFRWHRIELAIERSENTRRLKISGIDVDEVLPHTIIAYLRVSTRNSLVLWSTCPPQGQWWDDQPTEDSASHSDQVTTIALSVCLSVTILIIILLGFYTCYLSRELKKNQQVETEDSSYAEWKDIMPKDGSVSLTPPSSASYTSKDNGTIQTVFM